MTYQPSDLSPLSSVPPSRAPSPPSSRGGSPSPPSSHGGSPSPPSSRGGSPLSRGGSPSPLSSRGGSPSPPSSRGGSPSPPSSRGGSPSPPSSRGGSPSPPSSRGGSPSPPSSRGGSPSPPSSRGGSPSPPSSRGGSPSPPSSRDGSPSPPTFHDTFSSGLNDSQHFMPLYPGADVTMCSIMQFCQANKLSYTAIGELLKLLDLICPREHQLPKSFYAFKKFFQQFKSDQKHVKVCTKCMLAKATCSCAASSDDTADLISLNIQKPLETILSSKVIVQDLKCITMYYVYT